MLYTFIVDQSIFVSNIDPDVDFEAALDNSFVAVFNNLEADFAKTPIENILRNGGAVVKSA